MASIGIDHAAYDRIPMGEGIIGRTALEGETYVTPADQPSETNLTACIPLKLNGRVTGVICISERSPSAWS